MRLTAKQILERKIITGPLNEDNIAQVGVDLNVINILNIGNNGYIPREGKTILPSYTEIELMKDKSREFWWLSPGVYSIVLAQGCNIPKDCSMELFPRSSLARCGGDIVSPIWDPGFRTEQMTSFMRLQKVVRIEKGARLLQACVILNSPLEDRDLYNGQFQGK